MNEAHEDSARNHYGIFGFSYGNILHFQLDAPKWLCEVFPKMKNTVSVELDFETANTVLSGFKKQRAELSANLQKMDERIAQLAAQLKPAGVNGASVDGRKKGNNEIAVTDFLKTHPEGAQVREIADNSQVGVSSVYLVLKKNPDKFKKGDSGKWFLKQ